MTTETPEFKRGQIWKNKRYRPTAVFLIKELYTKLQDDGKESLRARGTIAQNGEFVDHDWDDCVSILSKFPFLMFDPHVMSFPDTQ